MLFLEGDCWADPVAYDRIMIFTGVMQG